MKHVPWILALACCVVVAAGCLKAMEPTSPGGGDLRSAVESSVTLGGRDAADLAGLDAAPGFYPLEIGNAWHYRLANRLQLIPNNGSPEPPFNDPGSIDVEMTCTEVVADRSYAVEHATYSSQSGETETWVRYRQDRSGLYELDVSIFDPPACAAVSAASAQSGAGPSMSLADRVVAARPEYRLYRASFERLERKRAALEEALRGQSLPTARESALEGELTRLAYPLRTGAQWNIRTDPAFVATVEGTDAFILPAGRFHGYRIRIEAPSFFGANDRVLTWYDRHGALKLLAHLEAPWTDADGNIIGKVISDETRELDDLTLVALGRF